MPQAGTGKDSLSNRTGDIASPHVAAAEPLYIELQDFCRSVVDGVVPRSSAALGLDVVRMIEAVEESLASEGSRTPLSLAGSLYSG